MRVYKLNTSLLTLLLAHIALAVTFGIGFFILANSAAGRTLSFFYAPTEYFRDLCLPSRFSEKYFVGSMSDRFLEGFSFYFFGLVQWYLIFLSGIGIFRYLSKR
jgi:hypothetical protein